MNDTELDEMLNKWNVPEVPASMRDTAKANFAALRKKKPASRFAAWRSGFAPRALATAAAAACLVLLVAKAAPQTFDPRSIPYVVDSQLIRYRSDGSSRVLLDLKSYNRGGSEVILSRGYPGDSFHVMVFGVLDATRAFTAGITSRFDVGPAEAAKLKTTAWVNTACSDSHCMNLETYTLGQAPELLTSGCTSGGTVAGHETLLDYPTVAIQHSWNGDRKRRMTLWMAPSLGCFALKVRMEEPQPDGSFRLLNAKGAVKVTTRVQ